MRPIAHPVNQNPFLHECTYNFLFLACNTLRPKPATTRLVTLWIMTYGLLVGNVKAAPPNFRPFMLIQGLAINIPTISRNISHLKTNDQIGM